MSDIRDYRMYLMKKIAACADDEFAGDALETKMG